jgi:hypothetical protein
MALTVTLYTDDFEAGARYAQIQELDGQHLIGEVLIGLDEIEQIILLLTQFQQEAERAR